MDAPTLKVTKDDNIIGVHNICSAANVQANANWLMQFEKLDESNILPQDKRFNIRDDHGRKDLQVLWNKIRMCPYVKECINSLPFNPHDKNFIKRIYPNGKIEIVLTWEDGGYGMVIQTTGRGQYQTQKIANILYEYAQ